MRFKQLITAVILVIQSFSQIIPVEEDTPSSPILTSSLVSSPNQQDEKQRLLRLSIAQTNQERIKQHNQFSQTNFTLGPNDFIALNEQEFKQTYLTLLPSQTLTIQYAKGLGPKKGPIISSPPTNIIAQNVQTLKHQSIGSSFQRPSVQPPQALVVTTPEVSIPKKSIQDIVKKLFKERNISEEVVEQFDDNKTESVPAARRLQAQPIRNLQSESGNMNVDWTCVSGQARSQGKCGACYAFAPLQAFAAILAIYHYGFYVNFSPQEIVDCSKNSLTFGCYGGFLEGSYSYMQVTGVSTQFTYPYVNENSIETVQACKKKPNSRDNFVIDDFVIIKENDCNELLKALQNHPISVAIAGFQLMFYDSGVFDSCDDAINHAVMVVGYKQGVGWKIKNTWGKRWGDNGFAWISEQNNCGICKIAQYPIPRFADRDFNVNNKKKTCPL